MGSEDIKESIGKRIRYSREKLGITQEQLAERLGKTRNTISSYESGTRLLSISELPQLAAALEVPITYFFDEFRDKEQATIDSLISHLHPIFQHGLLEILQFSGTIQEQLFKRHPEIELASSAKIGEELLMIQETGGIGQHSEQIDIPQQAN